MSVLLIIATPVLAVTAGFVMVAVSSWWAARGTRTALYPPRFGYVRIEEVPAGDRIRWP
ncbi:hypothetical protein ACWIGI_37630 [Nocardia sp. NPDC055321]